MKRVLKIAVVVCLVLITLSVVTFSPAFVSAVSGVDNGEAYSEALQAVANTTIQAIQAGWEGSADHLDRGLVKIVDLFAKAIAP